MTLSMTLFILAVCTTVNGIVGLSMLSRLREIERKQAGKEAIVSAILGVQGVQCGLSIKESELISILHDRLRRLEKGHE